MDLPIQNWKSFKRAQKPERGWARVTRTIRGRESSLLSINGRRRLRTRLTSSESKVSLTKLVCRAFLAYGKYPACQGKGRRQLDTLSAASPSLAKDRVLGERGDGTGETPEGLLQGIVRTACAYAVPEAPWLCHGGDPETRAHGSQGQDAKHGSG